MRRNTAQFDQWRSYIHDLEGRLALPPSGSPERAAFDAGQLEADRARHELPAAPGAEASDPS